MAPLSHDLSGLMVFFFFFFVFFFFFSLFATQKYYDYYRSHLDNSGKTTDVKLEAADFEKAGVTLVEVWNKHSHRQLQCVCSIYQARY